MDIEKDIDKLIVMLEKTITYYYVSYDEYRDIVSSYQAKMYKHVLMMKHHLSTLLSQRDIIAVKKH